MIGCLTRFIFFNLSLLLKFTDILNEIDETPAPEVRTHAGDEETDMRQEFQVLIHKVDTHNAHRHDSGEKAEKNDYTDKVPASSVIFIIISLNIHTCRCFLQ